MLRFFPRALRRLLSGCPESGQYTSIRMVTEMDPDTPRKFELMDTFTRTLIDRTLIDRTRIGSECWWTGYSEKGRFLEPQILLAFSY